MQPVIIIALFCVLVPAAVFDLRDRRIPNPLIVAGLGCALVLLCVGALHWDASLPAAAGIALLLQSIRAFGSVRLGSPGMGMGDLKLLVVAALFLGWEVYWILYLAIVSAGLVAVGGLLSGRINRKTPIPFAPFIVLGALAGLFWLPWERAEGWLI